MLLHRLGLEFEIVPPHYEADIRIDDPEKKAMYVALEKARSVAGLYVEGIVIGADTIVVVNGEILGKPKSRDEAMAHLRKLSGVWHRVITGLAIVDAGSGKEVVDSSVTEVKFRELSEEEISRYVDSGEPYDKAGAYAIQGAASLFIEEIRGDFWNVVGLPLPLLYRCLKEHFGLCLLDMVRPEISLI